jgi:spore germination protein GerM
VNARRRFLAVALGVVCAGTACGVPTGEAPTSIAPSDVPYGLTVPSHTPTAAPLAEPALDAPRVFLVAQDDRLVARPRELQGTTREKRLDSLLAELAAGPTGEERDLRLSTALPPDVRLTLGGLVNGTATIDIRVPAEAPSGWASRRAVAQIVLTTTSVPGVEAVRLTLTGEPVEAPLPGGELTSEPLTAPDYTVFVTAPPSAVPATPTPVPAPPS